MQICKHPFFVAVVGGLFCLGPHAAAQRAADQQPTVSGQAGDKWSYEHGSPYSPKPVSPVPFENSPRIGSLMRDGNLYLSLQDAIALALENNLDIELQRFNPGIAGADLLRAKGGGTLRGVPFSVTQPPSGLGGPVSPLLTSSNAPALPVATSIPVNISDLAAIAQTQTNLGITGSAPLSTGPALPRFDPTIAGSISANHQRTPQSNPFVSGTDLLSTRTISENIGVVQGFSPGTQLSLGFNGSSLNTNSLRSAFNPYTNSALGLTITQPLLRGFGPGVNRRFIRIAKNNEKISDLVFRQQVIDTVAGVTRLYYDYVSLVEDVAVKQQTLAAAQKLYEDNKLQVEQGTLAPIDLLRTQAQVAASRQDLANSQGFAREQELILKTVLTRRGTADPAVRAAHIIPTDTTPAPDNEPVRPIQDLLGAAFRNRPDLSQADLQISNSQISLEGSRNQLLPDVSLFATAQSIGLAGQLNPLAVNTGGTAFVPNPSYIGGPGTALSQVFSGRYPAYGGGIQLNLPIRNRVAQADLVRDEMQLRQTQVRRQQLQNQVRLEVEDALIAIERTRAAYEAAVQTRILQEQSMTAEQERFSVGLSTTFLLIQYQTLLAQARSTELAARGAYAKARVNLDRAIGATLEANAISIDEAYHGRVSRAPSAPPVASK